MLASWLFVSGSWDTELSLLMVIGMLGAREGDLTIVVDLGDEMSIEISPLSLKLWSRFRFVVTADGFIPVLGLPAASLALGNSLSADGIADLIRTLSASLLMKCASDSRCFAIGVIPAG